MKSSTMCVMTALAALAAGGAGALMPPDDGMCYATVVVVNVKGGPIAEAPVRISPLDGGVAMMIEGVTGKDGSVVFSIPGGDYMATSWRNKSRADAKFWVVFDYHPVVTLVLDPDAP